MIELLLNAENALALGLLDSAERTYRTVLEADPRNGIAAVGLSRVALERGDEAGALALAQAALEIDPENATARRMIDRLEEVARFRAAAAAAATPAAAEDRAAAAAAMAPAAPAAAAIPNDAPNHPPPARPGLLWRILRRS
jgi:tetratricopeptide (TPR) repeat protein